MVKIIANKYFNGLLMYPDLLLESVVRIKMNFSEGSKTKQDSFLVQSMKLIGQGVGKEWKKLDHFILFFE